MELTPNKRVYFEFPSGESGSIKGFGSIRGTLTIPGPTGVLVILEVENIGSTGINVSAYPYSHIAIPAYTVRDVT